MNLLPVTLAILLGSSWTASAADKRTAPPELGDLAGAEAKAFYLGLDAVIWGYPAVFFEDLMLERTQPEIVRKGNPQSLVNQFGHVRELRGPEFTQIATPNNDTLYSQAFCDVSREPLILSVPKVDDKRYYAMQFWDPNGDTFGYVGTRTTGREVGHYGLVGPGWKGELPAGVKRIDCPYNGFVSWGRTGVNGPEDVPNARAIQDQLLLTPLSRFGKAGAPVVPDESFSRQRVTFSVPEDLPEELLFFFKLARALRFTPPKAGQDDVIAASLAKIGFKDGNTVFDYHHLTAGQKRGLAKAYQFGQHLMDVEAETTGQTVRGWRWSPSRGFLVLTIFSAQHGPSGSLAATLPRKQFTWMGEMTTRGSRLMGRSAM
ncbi:DUF1254 domain-containing protein [Verrucomicrobium spinosum]|uniref:DUF1254 domain-containing protein n=1 Tax=Verrucomicrobium spinosum TaxID=2736 RepID=UPI0009462659|nr:DUF1254 domain-containing protein [Verrucomicrobium spinosum]